MIIELFGPECAGKTTFARALSAQLQQHNQAVEVALSCRPAETIEPLGRAADRRNPLVSRVIRSGTEALSVALRPIGNATDLRVALGLISKLPPRNPLWTIKQAQYIVRLSHTWRAFTARSPIVLFDQAFIQVICALLLLGGIPEDAVIADAINHLPRSDLLIRLVAPFEVIEGRLRARRSSQSGLEQLLEFSASTSLASIQIADRLTRILIEQGRTVLSVNSADQHTWAEGMNAAEELLRRRMNVLQRIGP